jgi:polyhydroxybutyrate depolymerase
LRPTIIQKFALIAIISAAFSPSARVQAPANQPQADKQETVTVEDVTRSFLVHLPNGFDSHKKYPVVLVIHDRDNDAADMSRISHFDSTADQVGAIIVYPNAIHERWLSDGERDSGSNGGYGHQRGGSGGGSGGGVWGGGGHRGGGGSGGSGRGGPGNQQRSAAQLGNELAYFNALLDQVEEEYPVDTARVYATGFSEGAFVDFQLGCNLSNRIAAIAPVGATLPKSEADICTNWNARPVALLLIEGTADPVMPYKGHSQPLQTLSAEDTMKSWSKMDGCSGKSQQTKLAAQMQGDLDTRVDSYSDCQQGTEVTLYSIQEGGHFWPGGEQPYVPVNRIGKTNAGLNADEIIWKFFVAHPMRSAK